MGQITIYTYAVSQSSEKVRWALDSADIPYTEKRLTSFLHLAVAGDGPLGTVPVMEGDGETIPDSTRILEWLELHRAPFSLIPRDTAVRAKVMAAESRFDMAAAHLLRLTYGELLKHKDLALRLWSLDAGPLQRMALRAGYGLVARVFEAGLDASEVAIKRSQRIVDRTIGELDRLAASGRPFLVGDTLTVADITAAAMLSPLACPDEHPVYSRSDYRKLMAPALAPWHDRPGLEWVRHLYRVRGLATAQASGDRVTGPQPGLQHADQA